ncbi:protein takeout-like [Bombyx mandarina]|uniref:Protein takeout-like n=1 Tax=Bombyx mandarina TaxID=7092 RepID=A0A6J2KDJ8_BOMMA|nr:protein takeout-like [Bombyx mandarina]
MLTFLCLFALVLGVKSASAPFITPCKVGDSACFVASAQAAVPIVAAGIPDLGIKPLDPLHISVINGNQGGLELTFKDTIVRGLSGCHVEGVKNDPAKKKQAVTIKCSVTLTGDYKLSGKLLVLPIEGEGKYNIKIRDIVIKTANDLVTVTGADGKPHWHIESWKHTYEVKTGAHFQFENLFNGNKVLATPVEEFVNSNWKDVMQEVAPPIVRSIVSEVVAAVDALYKAVPAEDLYLQ